jgi:hypothetical protein
MSENEPMGRMERHARPEDFPRIGITPSVGPDDGMVWLDFRTARDRLGFSPDLAEDLAALLIDLAARGRAIRGRDFREMPSDVHR